jgi:hypothetical protein
MYDFLLNLGQFYQACGGLALAPVFGVKIKKKL